jgi:hypothetical protein
MEVVMFKFALALIACLAVSCISSANDDMKIIGMPSVAFNSGNLFLNFGGPSFKLESGDYFGGLSFYPSLRHNGSANEWSPILGAGVFIGRNNFFFVIPSYYYSSTWYTALGLGYKF